MPIWNALFGGGVKAAGEGINATLGGIGTLAKDIRSAITGEMSPEKKAEIQQSLIEIEARASQSQNEVNAIEARHASVFVAGWRPFIGWVCGFSVAYNFIVHPLLTWMAEIWFPGMEPPALNIEGLMSIVMGMLGLGAMRTYEKYKNVNGKH